MAYMAGDNNLDRLAGFLINTMEGATTSSYVKTVVQVDTQNFAIKGSTTAKRLLIQQDADPNNVTSPTIQDLGEINSASGTAVRDFVVWAKNAYPSDRYVLILFNHGGQFVGFGTDETSAAGVLNFTQLKTMFSDIQSASGIQKLDLVAFDACLMACVEIDQMLTAYASYRVASSELVYAGLNYRDALTSLAGNPAMSPEAFGRIICDTFAALKTAIGINNYTLSLADLSKTPQLVTAVNSFANSLAANLPLYLQLIALARRLSFEYGMRIHGRPAPIVDLRHLASLVAGTSGLPPALIGAANNLISALDIEIIYRVQGIKAPFHGGSSIYYPNCSGCDPDQPAYVNTDLAATTQWNEYVDNYNAWMAADTTQPGAIISGPASGTFVSPASPVNVTFTISGSDIFDVSAVISRQISATQFLVFGEREFGGLAAGTWVDSWDAKVEVIWDGVAAFSDWLCAFSAQRGSPFFFSKVRYTPSIGPVRDIWMYSELTPTTLKVLGFYEVIQNSIFAGLDLKPGETIKLLYPIYDTTTQAYTYQVSTLTLTVPAAGIGAFQIYFASLPSGTHTYALNVEDMSENFKVVGLDLNVP